MTESPLASLQTGPLGVVRSPNFLQKILEATRECVLIVDADLRIANWNAPAERAFARPGFKLAGKRLTEVIRDLDLHGAFRRAVINGEPSDVRLEIIGTERRKFDVHVAPIELDGTNCGIGFFYDTTQIERLEAVRQEFLSNISHELRTPLTSILAFVETLEDGAIEDQENNRRFLGVIRRNAERMSSLIADILELSLIESGKVSIEKRPVKVADLSGEVLASLSAKAIDREVELINAVPAEMIWPADPVRLEQMLVNLVDNAIKFNRRGGSVTIAAVRDDETLSISVTDTGEGILPEHLPRIFERFYRIDRARSREIGGTGLGLAIVKHLARLHGGNVSVSSTLNRGTSFYIELPVE
jgi:two-component system phosphate regulon sensor histidine kinase PhoR